jgi:hypothetical protein
MDIYTVTTSRYAFKREVKWLDVRLRLEALVVA